MNGLSGILREFGTFGWAGGRRQAAAGWVVLVAVLAMPGMALAYPELGAEAVPAAGLDAERGAVLESLRRWDLPAAREALARVSGPRGPAEELLASRIDFHDGDYEGALRRLEATGLAATREAASYRELVEATLGMARRLDTAESAHFALRYDGGADWVLAEPALEALEAGRAAIAGWLGAAAPEGKVRIEVAPTAEDFQRVSGLSRAQIENGGAVAVCAFNKVVLLSPRLLARGYPWRDSLNHEYLHYVLVRESGHRAPIWLQEGVARYAEALWRGGEPGFLDDTDRSLLARALREGRLIPFGAMDPSLVSLPSMAAVRLAFAECSLAAGHLVQRWGVAGLRRLLARFAEGTADVGTDAALRAALGVPLAEFEAGWRAALEQGAFREIPGVVVPGYRLAGAGSAEELDLAEWQPLAAQNHVRLGDLLRTRGNAGAALMEYDRARKAAPASPYAHVKASRALLALGRVQEAAAAAAEAARLARAYPAAHEALAAALAAQGDGEGAAAALRGALEINPFNPWVWRDLARALRRLGRAGEAQRAAATALRLRPDDGAFQRSVMEN